MNEIRHVGRRDNRLLAREHVLAARQLLDHVEQEIDQYYERYGLDGIFFDEVSPSAASYYDELYDYVKGIDEDQLVILNPGSSVPESYEDFADIVIVYENYGIPSDLDSNGIAEGKLGVLPHGIDVSEAEFKELSDGVGFLYASPDWLDAAANVEDQSDWAD